MVLMKTQRNKNNRSLNFINNSTMPPSSKDKKAAAVPTTRRRPQVEHIINDHAGTGSWSPRFEDDTYCAYTYFVVNTVIPTSLIES
jgi:hypothetical protein